jgi:predicted small metal-binding protein
MNYLKVVVGLLVLLKSCEGAVVCVFSTGRVADPQERCSLWVYQQYWAGNTIYVTTDLDIPAKDYEDVDLGPKDPFDEESEHDIVKQVTTETALAALKAYNDKQHCEVMVLSGHAGPSLSGGLLWDKIKGATGLANSDIVAKLPDTHLYFTMCGCNAAGTNVKYCPGGSLVPLMITKDTKKLYGFYKANGEAEALYKAVEHDEKTHDLHDCKQISNDLLKAIKDEHKQSGKMYALDGTVTKIPKDTATSFQNAFIEGADGVVHHKKSILKRAAKRSGSK